jgi:hypothetical protein
MLCAFQRSRVCVYLVVFAVAIACAGAATADYVTNGDFTTDNSGWSITRPDWWTFGRNEGTESPSSPSPGGCTVPSPGGASAFWLGNSWLYQNVTSSTLVAGHTYELSFLASLLNEDPAGDHLAANQTLTAQVRNDAGYTTLNEIKPRLVQDVWNSYNFQFTPTTDVPNFTVRFLNPTTFAEYGWSSFGLDSVSLHEVVPEPSAMVLVSMGMLSLLAYAWRKQR